MAYATYENTVEKLKKHRITIRGIALIGYENQHRYQPDLTLEQYVLLKAIASGDGFFMFFRSQKKQSEDC
ncbi:hypothetical protein GQS40_09460|uniref:Uncharacterized protein n=1 Tax=Leuconostoc lactis TaxID=1246 RepID=A0A6L7A794_LEULA|nr:hypothetical protein [Leuconostoc lactis]